ncbi:hypothetical protein [Coleofasciculus sp. F4-SAH-05]|uniref:hypothetical protein n=1 Tax=Coleofasciculus sp. F4-SAH-05 TaxID=3069525 RepID=UPI0032F2DB7B
MTRQRWWLVIVLSGLALILAQEVALLYQVQPGLSLWFFPSLKLPNHYVDFSMTAIPIALPISA